MKLSLRRKHVVVASAVTDATGRFKLPVAAEEKGLLTLVIREPGRPELARSVRLWRSSPSGPRRARAAVAAQPDDGNLHNTLGVALCQAGKWGDGLHALQKSMELQKGGKACDWLFVAMAKWHLGHKDDARKWYEKAITWMEKNEPDDEELKRFRAEAEEMLGMKPK